MFSGIIEMTGRIHEIRSEGTNKIFTIASDLSKDTYIDQSIAHNGVCLTVVAQTSDHHTVVAVQETLLRSNIGNLDVGAVVNLERAITTDKMLDGHIVQGHVDDTGVCTHVEEVDGSWLYTFEYDIKNAPLLVDKGSVAINGVSLTVITPEAATFQVTIIPYTYEHTSFGQLAAGDRVNLEFDIIGKYVQRHLQHYRK